MEKKGKFLNLEIHYLHSVVLVDPGWNDPPMLNYSASNPPPKSRITNKRVAFPLNTMSTTKSQAMSSLNASYISSVPPFALTPTIIDSSEISNPVPDILGEAPDPFVSDSTMELSNFITNEENRKLFLNSWNENKFSSNCKESLKLFCEYLKKKDMENVIKVKQALLTEYKDLCDEWINSIEM